MQIPPETVEQMLSLHKKLSAAKTGHEQEVLQRQIEAADAVPVGGEFSNLPWIARAS